LVESFIHLDVLVEFGVFLAGKWVCFPGDWEEAHGDDRGRRKQWFVDQMLFSLLDFSFWTREWRGETLEK